MRKWFSKKRDQSSQLGPIISSDHHCISHNNLSEHALKVMRRLHQAGFQAYLVGGGVRDALLNRKTKDHDIATDAHPEQIRKLFSNSRIIGRRFRLVHVFFKQETLEVSTFRANIGALDKSVEVDGGQVSAPHSDNEYGTIEEDAWRRDFTVNALYCNIADFSIVDFTGGMQDLLKKQLRIIGDPVQRFHEDPGRLLRAIRFSAKLGFDFHSDTCDALFALPHLLQQLPPSRFFLEWTKMFLEGFSYAAFYKLKDCGYLDALLPVLVHDMRQGDEGSILTFLDGVLRSTDERFANDLPLSPGFLLSAFLWPSLQMALKADKGNKRSFYQSLHKCILDILHQQKQVLQVPNRFISMIRNIWLLQFNLERMRPSRIQHVFNQRYFRAAFDLLELRYQAGQVSKEIYTFWKQYRQASATKRERMRAKLQKKNQQHKKS